MTVRNAFTGASNGEYRYSYDNNFFQTGIALDNVWTTLAYDDDGLMTGRGAFTFARSGPAGATSSVSDLTPRQCGLDEFGQPVTCPPGTFSQEYGYDNVGRLNHRTTVVEGVVVYEEILGRDVLGRINHRSEKAGSGSSIGYRYFYDRDGQLDNVVLDSAPNPPYEKFVYDNNGNLTDRVGAGAGIVQTGIQFDNQDREIGTDLVFDADGFLERRGSRNYRYSAKGELLAVLDNVTGLPIVSYVYDGTNRRVARIDRDGNLTQYLYGNLAQPFQITASRTPDNVLTSYFYDDFGALYALERDSVRYYVASDHLGTPKVVTDNAGNILDAMEYDSYGVRISGGNAFDLPVGFAGGLVDNASTMVRFGFRDYEPETGRWLSKDPIFHRGGLNLYVYAANNPVNRKDVSGLHDRPYWHDHSGIKTGAYAYTIPSIGLIIYNRSYDQLSEIRKDSVDHHELTHKNNPDMSEVDVLRDEINYNNAVLGGLDPNSPEYVDLIGFKNDNIFDLENKTRSPYYYPNDATAVLFKGANAGYCNQ